MKGWKSEEREMCKRDVTLARSTHDDEGCKTMNERERRVGQLHPLSPNLLFRESSSSYSMC